MNITPELIPVIGIDSIAFITTLQQKLYVAKTTVLDELLQNAQRAGATEVRVNVSREELVFTDNGGGIADWSALLMLARTGWPGDVAGSEDPFGIGFWSITLLNGNVKVETSAQPRDTACLLIDVPRMCSEQSLDVVTVTEMPEELYDAHTGTRIHVTNPDGLNYDAEEFQVYLCKAAKWLKLDVWLDGRKLTSRQSVVVNDDEEKFAVKIDSHGFTGTVAPTKGYAQVNEASERLQGGIDLLYQNRVVKNLEMIYSKGVVAAANGAINPRAPDRKDVIQDDKFWILKSIVRDTLKNSLRRVLLEGTDADVEAYQNAIVDTLNYSDYSPLIRFQVTTGKALVFAEEAKKKAEIKVMVEAEMATLYPEAQDFQVENPLPELSTLADSAAQGHVIDTAASTPEKPVQTVRVDEIGNDVFYVDAKDVLQYVHALEQAEAYGIQIVVVANRVQRSVVAQRSGWRHIGTLGSLIRIRTQVLSTEARDAKEIRLKWLLECLSACIQVPIVFGDINSVRMLEGMGLEIPSGKVLGVAYAGSIFIDREHLMERVNGYRPGKGLRPTKADCAALLRIVPTLAHEMAHIVESTYDRTTRHLEATDTCYEQLIDIIVGWL